MVEDTQFVKKYEKYLVDGFDAEKYDEFNCLSKL